MAWFHNNKRYWRIAFLLLLILAIGGPWAFDRISVPAQYPCYAPNIRLDENFCGLPIPFTWIFSEIIRAFTSPGFSLPFFHSNPVMEVAFWLVLSLFMLPLVSTAISILWPDLRRWHFLHRVGLGLATGLAGVYGILGVLVDFSTTRWMLWGLWLYLASALSMLLLEILVLRQNRRLVHE